MHRSPHLPATLSLVLALCAGSAAAAPGTAGAEPADPAARTRLGLYLTAAQARELIRELDDRAVTVVARCCGPALAELDVLLAFEAQAATQAPGDVTFIVRGTDLRQAAAVANRLAELGARQAYLVTR